MHVPKTRTDQYLSSFTSCQASVGKLNLQCFPNKYLLEHSPYVCYSVVYCTVVERGGGWEGDQIIKLGVFVNIGN